MSAGEDYCSQFLDDTAVRTPARCEKLVFVKLILVITNSSMLKMQLQKLFCELYEPAVADHYSSGIVELLRIIGAFASLHPS
jgi:hypothetical protein